MGTRARVAIELADGKILSSYVHYDGYPAGLGYNLIKNWSNHAVLHEAIKLGDASTWGSVIGEKHDFDSRDEKYSDMNLYYGRDRGEPLSHPLYFKDEYDLLINGCDAGEEYIYFFKSPPAFDPGVGCSWHYVENNAFKMHKGFQLLHYKAAKDHHAMMKRVAELEGKGVFVG